MVHGHVRSSCNLRVTSQLSICVQDRGVQMGMGDGTVPLLSLGGMCRGGWLNRRLNPSGSRIVTKEYPHNPITSVIPSRCARVPAVVHLSSRLAVQMRHCSSRLSIYQSAAPK